MIEDADKKMKTLMKAAQITKYSKDLYAQINDIPIPEIDDKGQSCGGQSTRNVNYCRQRQTDSRL